MQTNIRSAGARISAAAARFRKNNPVVTKFD
jgi:hypothetical protein